MSWFSQAFGLDKKPASGGGSSSSDDAAKKAKEAADKAAYAASLMNALNTGATGQGALQQDSALTASSNLQAPSPMTAAQNYANAMSAYGMQPAAAPSAATATSAQLANIGAGGAPSPAMKMAPRPAAIMAAQPSNETGVSANRFNLPKMQGVNITLGGA